MGALTGANSNVIVKTGSTFGTAATGGSGDRVTGTVSRAQNPVIVRPSPIGAGLDMDNASQVLAVDPVVTIDEEARYDGGLVAAEAVFFGADSVSAGTAAWSHSFVYEANRHQRFQTIAFDGFSAGLYEYPSCTPRKITVNGTPNSYVKKNVEFLANNEVTSATTNTTLGLRGSTVATTVRQVAMPADYVLINAAGGAGLSTSDKVAVTSWSVDYNYEVQHVAEIQGTAGQGTPVVSGDAPFQVTVTLNLKNQADFTWVTAQSAATEYKMEIRTTSSQFVTGAVPYLCYRRFPRLILLQDPGYNLQQPGENPLALTFKALVAASIPTGMISVYPHVEYRNAKSTSYTA